MSRSHALSMYRRLLRAAAEYPEYNVRDYIRRRAGAGFRENRGLGGDAAAAALLDGETQLRMVSRLSAITGFYKSEASVMEHLYAARHPHAHMSVPSTSSTTASAPHASSSGAQ